MASRHNRVPTATPPGRLALVKGVSESYRWMVLAGGQRAAPPGACRIHTNFPAVRVFGTLHAKGQSFRTHLLRGERQ